MLILLGLKRTVEVTLCFMGFHANYNASDGWERCRRCPWLDT